MSPSYLLLFSFGLITSIIAISFGIIFSIYFNVADHPSGHKQHQTSTPFIGGIGVISALLMVLTIAHEHEALSNIATGAVTISALIIFITGLADDIWRLDYKVRFLIQGAMACLMIYQGDVILTNLGQIAPGVSVELGPLAILFTLFATLGVINALNMIDGIDGLSGSISLASLILLAIVSTMSHHHHHYLILIIALIAGVTGFLGFNLRCYGRHRAAVFLGDNGSMLLGFLFAWIFIGLSQGESPAMTPVTALWLFAIPLIDTVTVMIRRLWLGKSPFYPDRHHLHHLLLRAGFRTNDVVLTIVLLHSLFGIIGLVGLAWKAPEWLMLAGFLGAFIGYLYIASRPWRFIPGLRRFHHWLGLTSANCQGVFIGHFSSSAARQLLRSLQEEMAPSTDYDLRVYRMTRSHETDDDHSPHLYAVLEIGFAEESQSERELRELTSRLKKRFSTDRNVEIRQYVRRNSANDRRVGSKDQIFEERRQLDRRSIYDKQLYENGHFLTQSFADSTLLDSDDEVLPASQHSYWRR